MPPSRHRAPGHVVSSGRIGLCIATLAMAATAWGDEAAPPVLHEGDRWVFVERDGFTNLEMETSTIQVRAVLADGYQVSGNLPGRPAEFRMTPELNTRQTIDGVANDSAELRFPLAVGKKWNALVAYVTPGRLTTGVFDMEREVVGMETRKTPAGEFQTYKIVGKGRWILKTDPSNVAVTDFNGRYETTCWFAPVAKTCVSVETRAFAKGHVGDWHRFELTQIDLH